jgi:hypothetical protein
MLLDISAMRKFFNNPGFFSLSWLAPWLICGRVFPD